MIYKKTTLSINTPCSEKFDNFLQTEKGGFCTVCQKEVIDFRSWSDEAIANYFKNTTQKTCGLFVEDQLKAYLHSNVQEIQHKKSSFKAGVATFSLLSLLAVDSASAQTKEKAEIVQIPIQQRDNQLTEGILVKGVVSDNFGPLLGINVVVKGTNIGTQTNFDGEFSFPTPLKKGDVLIVSFIGYKTKEVIVSEEYLTIKLIEDDIVLMGDVAVAKEYYSKPSFFQRIRNWFRNE
ncbi:conserved hypothetical protein [Flavobacterium sp. 9AF]|uniref:carboxypeptidase-like regulatory domain-containing protein n=1 Tax=Flavobacterium sp. 9AF TaxID=2653142 RepID=UPI0012F30C4C|nr:carboxypeptidase-like regulatory domain-containing protein [Flavobacterium sp. 9AF]VXB80905.1 conserved hypothetical protein [Flavobacterium sp. 9AF]